MVHERREGQRRLRWYAAAGGVVGDEVTSQVALLAVVWAVAGLLVWRYGTERLAPNPLPAGGLDLAAPVAEDGRRATTGEAPRATESNGGRRRSWGAGL